MQQNKPLPDHIVATIRERAAGIRLPEVLGSSEDLEQIGYESLLPAYSKSVLNQKNPTIKIGSSACKQPYQASVLNCSALSFGPLSKHFILAMNAAAFEGRFFQNTGEAGISPYHFGLDVDVEDPNFSTEKFFQDISQERLKVNERAGDIVWQIGTGYFGCRQPNGLFDPIQFRLKASMPNIKMVEIKLSQGVEPRKEMPVKALTAGMSKILGLQNNEQPAKLLEHHSSFSTPIELLYFVAELRNLCGGKPVGIKMGITHKYMFFSICKAMLKTGITPDFITIDGMEAGTAAASKGASGYTGTTLNESIVFVHNALVGIDLRDQIRIIASGRVFTERDIISKLARGADLCSTARAMFLAVGCDQQRECNKGACRKGIATQDPRYTANFDIQENAQRIANYHRITLEELNELLSIAGLNHPSELGPGYVQRRISPYECKTLDELYEYLPSGVLLSPFSWHASKTVYRPYWRVPKSYRVHWRLADPYAPFSAHPEVLSLHR